MKPALPHEDTARHTYPGLAWTVIAIVTLLRVNMLTSWEKDGQCIVFTSGEATCSRRQKRKEKVAGVCFICPRTGSRPEERKGEIGRYDG